MMLIFVFDLAFYVYRAFSVNQRMESIMTSMQKVIMENNYLPEGDYDMYMSIFRQLSQDMNSGDTFIAGIGTNYDHDPTGSGILTSLISTDATGAHRDLLVKQMSKPAQYGDVMICQSKVKITQPIWGFGTENHHMASDHYDDYMGQDSTYWNRVGYRTTTFYYTYYVPCLKYQSIQDI